MLKFGKKEKNIEEYFETDHRLVVFNEDKRTCDIVQVTNITDVSIISAGRYSVPKADCEVTTSEEGLVFFYRAPSRVIQEVERLARLEQSIVLTQITQYKTEPKENPNLDMKFWAIAFLLFVAIIAAAF